MYKTQILSTKYTLGIYTKYRQNIDKISTKYTLEIYKIKLHEIFIRYFIQ